jgi:uncharacterized membrane protein
MTLQPLLSASWAIQVHVLTLVLALIIGTWQFALSRKGAAGHRAIGYVFIALMIVTAIVTLFIHVRSPHSAFFGFSYLHLYVPLVFSLCGAALYGAATHRLRLHRFAVIALYRGSLLFTLIVQVFLAPGITHQIFFSR